MACMMSVASVSAGIDLGWAERQIAHVIHLLETEGPAMKQTVSDILKTIRFFTGKQFIQAFAMLTQDVTDVQGLIAAIQEEFSS
jgi:hypothetical protein